MAIIVGAMPVPLVAWTIIVAPAPAPWCCPRSGSLGEVHIRTVSRRGPGATLIGMGETWWRAWWPTVMLALIAVIAVCALVSLPWVLR